MLTSLNIHCNGEGALPNGQSSSYVGSRVARKSSWLYIHVNSLQKYRPKVAICSHKLDYCDTCAELAEGMRAKQTTLNRLQHTDSSDDEELNYLKGSIEELQSNLEVHKLMAK